MSQQEQAGGRPELEPDFTQGNNLNPYPHYARLRAQCPVAHMVGRSGLNPYVVTRYEDAKAALTDPRLSNDPRVGERAYRESGIEDAVYERTLEGPTHMLAQDPPEHTRMRRMVAAEFTTRRVAPLRPRIREIAEELIDVFAGKGEADLVPDFADPLPALVIAELLGVPREDWPRFRRWSSDIVRPTTDDEQVQSQMLMAQYLAEQIERKRREPGTDLLSALVSGPANEKFSEEELHGTAFLLLLAGHETTTHLIGNGMLALVTHPDQYALLRESPGLIPGAVEEFLRFDGSVERSTNRWAAEDLEIAGTAIPQGSVVQIALASADRDEAHFADADRLDVTRAPQAHLAFGHGVHFCLGAPLARLEADVAFEALLRRLPGLELAVPADQLVCRSSEVIRGLESLPVRFTPQPA